MPQIPIAPFSGAPILLAPSLRRMEKDHDGQLMAAAAHATCDLACHLQPDRAAPIVVLAGPGNNGGDGIWAAHLLRQKGYPVSVVHDPAWGRGTSKECQKAWQMWNAPTITALPASAALVIDGLLGIGIDPQRPMRGTLLELVHTLNERHVPVLALDVPSGLDAFCGTPLPIAVKAHHTLTFLALKPGLLTGLGAEYCGKLHLAPLLPTEPVGDATEPVGGVIDPVGDVTEPVGDAVGSMSDGAVVGVAHFRDHLQTRPAHSHKGLFGSLAVLGGAMAGAALLAARAGLHLGSGRVLVSGVNLPLDPLQPELMLRSDAECLAQATALVIGPGFGIATAASLHAALDSDRPLVLDADALNQLAQQSNWGERLMARAVTVLTPHPGEAARLLGCSTAAVQQDRLRAAQALMARSRAIVVLKGNGTIIIAPDGRWWINTSGNAALACPGSGDVLAGFIGALLAQQWPALEASLAGVHLHGLAADVLLPELGGSVGLTASELFRPARKIFNQWCTHESSIAARA